MTFANPAAVSFEDPAVLTWRIVLAPQPRVLVGRHWWRDLVTEAWRAAYDQWLSDLEHHGVGYATEGADWKRDNPCPRLADFMQHLSAGSIAPERITA